MSIRLERYVYLTLTLVTLALCALILVASPAVAQAKEGSAAATPQEEEAQASNRGAEATPTHNATPATQTPTTTHTVVVVRPGDSLWSISEEQLGPNATPLQIESRVERLWALNRHRIGADSNLILVGQELLVPPVGESSVNQPSAAAAPSARGAAEVANANEVGEASEQAPNAAAERATLPEAAAAPPVPAARPLTSSEASVPQDGNAKRQLLGWGLLALSFTSASVPAFLAARNRWRRRANRSIGEPLAEETYRANYALFAPSLADTTEEASRSEASRSVPGAPATAVIGQPSGAPADGILTEGNLRARSTGTFASARTRSARRKRKNLGRSERARPLREGLATGAHNPNVRRHLRATRGDAPRKRRRAKEPRRSAITRELANASKARGAQRTQGGR